MKTAESDKTDARSATGRWMIIASGACLLAAVIFAGVLFVTVRGGSSASARGLGDQILSTSHVPDVAQEVASRTGLDRRLRPLLESFPADSACIAVDAPEGARVFDQNAATSLVPASTLKLATSSAVLARFGPEHRFETEVLRGPDGTLYLRGGGDPTLASPDWIADHDDPPRLATPIQALAAQLGASGVSTAGGLVVDASRLDDAYYVDGWEPRFIADDIAPRVQALAVDRSDVDGDPAVAAGRTLLDLTGSADAPVRAGTTPADAEVVASLESPPVTEIVTELNKHSDNFIAEVLVRHLGRAAGGAGTTAEGTEAVVAELDALGIETIGLEMHDGSGLHYGNRMPCATIVDILEHAADEPWGDVLFGSLAVGGADGTLEEREQAGTVHAKTGTLREVSALAGFVETAEGPVRFAILMNGLPDDATGPDAQDDLVAELGLWPAP